MHTLRAAFAAMVLIVAPSAVAQTTAGTSTQIVVPVTAQTASFASETTLYNPNAVAITVDVAFYEANNSTTPGPGTCADVTIPALRSVQFALATQCTLSAASHFGLLVLTELTGTKPFYSFARVQNPQGIGFSTEGFPAANFNNQVSHATGLKKTTTGLIYQTNCFVGSLSQPVSYTLKLFNDATGAQIGSTIAGSLNAFEQIRYLDIFGPAGVNVAPANQLNVRAEFASSPTATLVGFCTVQDNASFGADFRIAKSYGTPGTVTSLAQGSGITLAPNPITTTGTIAVDTTTIQARVTGTCAAGSSIRTINANGTVVCETDDIGPGTVTSVATGTGLTGGPITTTGTITADTTYLQRRVSATCAVGSNIRAIAADGSVTCQSDNVGPTNAFVQDGNAFGAVAALGITDNFALDIRVNNSRVMRYEPSADGPNIVGGYSTNYAGASSGNTIGGGGQPGTDCYETATGTNTRFCGNSATGGYATVAGGRSNFATGYHASVGGGVHNTASGNRSVVVGGIDNIASGTDSSVGGYTNVASGLRSTVGGGQFNAASGAYATVPGGNGNKAGGDFSLSAGNRAVVRNPAQVGGGDLNGDEGSFVWADSNPIDFFSEVPNEFAVRATNGIRFVTAINGGGNATRTTRINPNGELDFGSQTRQMLNLWGPAEYGIGIQSGTLYFRTNPNFIGTTGGFSWFNGGSHNDGANNAGGGVEVMRLAANGTLYVTGGTVGTLSDRGAKRDFAAIDPAQLLDKVARLPLSSWVYKANPGVRHIGPTAQDFRAAFGLGDDDERSIATVDADGVALAAIQGLNAKLESALRERDATIAAQAARQVDLERQVAEFSSELADARLLRADLVALKAALTEMQRERSAVAAR